MSFVSISLGTAKRSDLYAALQPQSIFFLPKPSAQIGPLFKQAFAQTARPGQGPLPGPNRASAQTGLLPYQMTEKIGPTIGDSSSIALAPFLRPFFTGFSPQGRDFVDRMSLFRRRRGTQVIFIAHKMVRMFFDNTGSDADLYFLVPFRPGQFTTRFIYSGTKIYGYSKYLSQKRVEKMK